MSLVTVDSRGRVLLLKHVRPHAEYWVLPGGGEDWGETVDKALVREIKEELGVNVQPGNLVAIGELITPARHVLDVFVAGTLEKQEGFTIAHSEGIAEAEWIPRTDVARLDFRPIEMVQVLESVDLTRQGAPVYLGQYKDAESR